MTGERATRKVKRLTEALEFYGHPDSYTGHEQTVLNAAAAYRDLLARRFLLEIRWHPEDERLYIDDADPYDWPLEDFAGWYLRIADTGETAWEEDTKPFPEDGDK